MRHLLCQAIVRTRGGLGILLFLGAAGLVALRTFNHLSVPGNIDTSHFGMVDFRGAVYYPVVALLNGVNPYDAESFLTSFPVLNPFPPYSPITMIINLPFGVMPYEVSLVLYFIFSLCLMILLSNLVLRCSGISPSLERVFGLAAAMLLSRPGYSSLVLGQSTALAAVAVILALHFSKERPLVAGIALGVATFKPQFGIPLAILMLARGDFRAVTIGLIGAASGALLPLVIIISRLNGGFQDFVSTVFKSTVQYDTSFIFGPVGYLLRIDALTVVSRIVGRVPSLLISSLLSVGMLLLSGWAVWRLRATRHGQGADSLSGTIIVLTMLAVVYHMAYDALVLWIPLTALVLGYRGNWYLVPRAIRWPMAIALAFPLVNYLSTFAVSERLAITGVALAIVSSANGLAILVALVFSLFLAQRATRHSHSC